MNVFSEYEYSKEEFVTELFASYLSVISELKHDEETIAAFVKPRIKYFGNNPLWLAWVASSAS